MDVRQGPDDRAWTAYAASAFGPLAAGPDFLHARAGIRGGTVGERSPGLDEGTVRGGLLSRLAPALPPARAVHREREQDYHAQR